MKMVTALMKPQRKRLTGTIITLLRISSRLGFIEERLLTVPRPIDN